MEQSRGGLIHALLPHEFLILYPVNPASFARYRKLFAPSGARDDPTDAELKGYCPQALGWTGKHLASRLATDFLLKWPTLPSVQRVRPETVRSFYYAHNCRATERVEGRIAEIRAAEPLTTDPGIVEPPVLTVQMLARQLQALEPSIRAYDKEIAPVSERSGHRRFVHWRQSAPTFPRQTFHELARHSIQQSRWARAYYEQKRERGSRHHAAVRALAFKWGRILFRCWKDRVPYSEERYLDALRPRGSKARRERIPAAAVREGLQGSAPPDRGEPRPRRDPEGRGGLRPLDPGRDSGRPGRDPVPPGWLIGRDRSTSAADRSSADRDAGHT